MLISRATAAISSGIYALQQGKGMFAGPNGTNAAGDVVILESGPPTIANFWNITMVKNGPVLYTIVNSQSGLYLTAHGSMGKTNGPITVETIDTTTGHQLWAFQRRGTNTGQYHIFNRGIFGSLTVADSAGMGIEVGDLEMAKRVKMPAASNQLWKFKPA